MSTSGRKRLERDEVRALFCNTNGPKHAKTSAGPLQGMQVLIVEGAGVSYKRGQLLVKIAREHGAEASNSLEELKTDSGSLLVAVASPSISAEKLRTAMQGMEIGSLVVVSDEWLSACAEQKELLKFEQYWHPQFEGGRAPDSTDASSTLLGQGSTALQTPPQRVLIGDKWVDAIGFGTMGLGVLYPEPARRPSREESIAMIHCAIELGCEFFDTADSYSASGSDYGYVEALLRDAIASSKYRASNVCVATKGGMLRLGADSRDWRVSACTPDILYECCWKSRKALVGPDSTEPLFLWQVHHFNDKVTAITESLKGVAKAQKEGLIRHIGLCNVSVMDIVKAREVVEIVTVQNKFSLWDREAERSGVLQYCKDEGIAFIAHGALGGLSARQERYIIRLAEVARLKGVSTHAAALALMRHKWPNMIHITGARTKEHVSDIAKARHITFSSSEVNELWNVKPARYGSS